MKREILFGILILGILMSLGCTENTSSTTRTFAGGTNGVLINFAPESPPAEVFDSCAGSTNQFDIIVELNNDGEYDVPKDKALVTITGIMPEQFGYSPAEFSKHPPEDLIGKKVNQPSIPVQVEFPNLAYRGNVLGDIKYPTLRAEICYNYKTTAIAQACIKSNLRDTSKGACTIDGAKQVANSGAPIQVTSFVESVAGTDQVRFEITVEHKGNGNVFKQDSGCLDTFANRNRVLFTIESGIPGLRCTGLRDGSDTSGFITLSSDKGAGKAIVNCIQKVPTGQGRVDYQKDVTITLTYDYLSYKIQPIVVKKSC